MVKPSLFQLLRSCALGALVTISFALGGCGASTPTPAQPPPAQPYPGAPQQPQPYPQQPYPQQPQPYPQQPQATRPLLAPLVGTAAQQQEVRNVLNELISRLSPDKQALVRGIPLVFDPTVAVNAFAGCDDAGNPFLAGTQGILDAVDAIAQTKATDELFGTQTYDAYTNAVIPQMVRDENARAGLPAGLIPTNLGPDPRRWSRAHELFDDVVAFTFGHELAHHYLGHTGCAKGQGMTGGPDPMALPRLASNAVPWLNQFNEGAADMYGCINALDTGRARRPQYEWSEKGGVLLLGFFGRLESAAGMDVNFLNPAAFLKTALNQFRRDHPSSAAVRLPAVQAVAANWHAQHPG